MKTRRIFFVLMATVLMVACGGNNGTTNFTYEHPERYSAGDATIAQPIRSLSVNWLCGDVDILYSDTPEVRIYEKADTSLTYDLRLRYYVDDEGELEIQYCANGKYQFDDLKALRKHLYIELPRDMNLDDIEIDGVDVRVAVWRVQHRKLNVDGVNVNVNSYYPSDLPDEIDMDGVKSLLALHVVPETAGLTIEMDGVMNHLRCDVPSVKKDNKTIVGDGSCQVTVDGVDMIVDVIKLI